MKCPIHLDWVVVLEYKGKVVNSPFIMLLYVTRFIIRVSFEILLTDLYVLSFSSVLIKIIIVSLQKIDSLN